MGVHIIHANILEWAAAYDGEPFHALLCDPPYHLTENNKRYSAPDAKPCGYGNDGSFQRLSKGFMGRDWDGGDIAFRPETWAALARVLHPGAFLFAFAGTRGYHRMACAIEDAGLIIHPAIGWAFGSGFPKATRIDTQIDRRAGAARAKVGSKKHQPKFAAKDFGYREKDNGYNSRERESYDVTAPATALAQAWQGHRYGGQVLKPAFEFICVAQVPYAGRPVECITTTGAGALWIDGGRIGTDETWRDDGMLTGGRSVNDYGDGLNNADRSGSHPAGRWPANLMLSHAPECNGACAPHCPVRRLGEQSGETSSGARKGPNPNASDSLARAYDGGWSETGGACDASTGTAARFFFQADYMAERLEESDPLIYEAKADRSEREAGLDPRQVRLLGMMEQKESEQSRPDGSMFGFKGRTFKDGEWVNVEHFPEDTINDGRAKSIDNPYQRGETTRRNTHPTIKPIALARHLATLLLPPDEYAPRRILVPFSGAGSEMIGAMLAGWDEVVGLELNADHVRIAEARLAYWQQRRYALRDPSAPITAQLVEAPTGQLDLFDLPPWEADE